jgi:hypothetical protein
MTPKNKKIPKGRVTALQLEAGGPVTAPFYERYFCAVIPCATQRQACAIVKREATTYSDRYDAVIDALRGESNLHNQTRAVLGALNLLP